MAHPAGSAVKVLAVMAAVQSAGSIKGREPAYSLLAPLFNRAVARRLKKFRFIAAIFRNP